MSFCAYGQTIEKSTLDSGGVSVTAGNLDVIFTLGQVNIREVVVGNLSVSEGFINSELNGCQVLITQEAQNLVLDFDSSNDIIVNNWLNNNGNASATSLDCGDLIWSYNILSDNLSDTDGDETLDRLTILIEFTAEGDFGNNATTNASIIFNDFASAGESAGNGGAICNDSFPVGDFDDDLFFDNDGIDYTDAKFDSSSFEIVQTAGKPGLQLVDGGTTVKFPDTGAGQFTYNFDYKVQTTVTIGNELPRTYETTASYTANNVTVAFEPGPNITVYVCDFNNLSLLDLYNRLEIELDVDTSEFNEAEDFGNVFEPENSWYNENDNLEVEPNLRPDNLTSITEPGVYQFNAKNFLEDCAGEPVFVTLVTDQIINEEAQDLTIIYDPNGNDAEIDAWLANNGGAIATNCEGVTWEWELIDSELNESFNPPSDTFFQCTIEFKVLDINQNQIGSSTAFIKLENFPSAGDNVGNGSVECEATTYDLNVIATSDFNSSKFNSSNVTITQAGGFPGATVSGTVVDFPDTGAGQFSYNFQAFVETPITIGDINLNVESSTIYTVQDVIIPFDPGPDITVQVCNFGSVDLLDLYDELQIALDVDASVYNEASDFGNVFDPANSWYNQFDDLEANPNTPPLTEITTPGVYQFNAKNFLADCAGEPTFVTIDFIELEVVESGQDLIITYDPNGNETEIDAWLANNGGITLNRTEGIGWTYELDYFELDDPFFSDSLFIYVIFTALDECTNEYIEFRTIEIQDFPVAGETNQGDGVVCSKSINLNGINGVNFQSSKYSNSNVNVSGPGTISAFDVDFPDTGAGQFSYGYSFSVTTNVSVGTINFDVSDSAGWDLPNVTIAFDPGPDQFVCESDVNSLGDLFNQLEVVDGTNDPLFDPDEFWFDTNGQPITSYTGPGEYIFNAEGFLPDCGGIPATVTVSGTYCNTLISPIVSLQGPSLNPNIGEETLMRDDLRVNDLIPTTSPYTDNLNCDSSVFNTIGPNAIVDWVWVELRDGSNASTIVASRSGLVQRDGDIVDVDGLSDLSFPVSSGNYYIALNHRNHLGIMSSAPIALSESATVVDFSDGSTDTFGSNAQVILPDGSRALWAGDINGDGKINFIGTSNDTNILRDTILNDPINIIFQSFSFNVSGYSNVDVNLNGVGSFIGSSNDTNVLRDNVLGHPINQIFQSFSYSILEQLPNTVPQARLNFDVWMKEYNESNRPND